MTPKEIMYVVQAFADGRKIEYSFKSDNRWRFINNPSWSFNIYDYRIAPKEAPKNYINLNNPLSRDLVFTNSDIAGYRYTTEDYICVWEHNLENNTIKVLELGVNPLIICPESIVEYKRLS